MGGPLHQDGQKQRRVNFPFFVALYKEQLEPTWETFFFSYSVTPNMLVKEKN